MQLTSAQLTTLAAAINADAALATMRSNHDATLICNYYNVASSPAFIVWKTDVSADDIMRNGMDWTRVDNLSVGKSRIWDWMTKLGSFNAAKPNVRAGIDACWVGTAADLAVRDQVYTHCKRTALKGEALFTTGTGSTASPATMADGCEGFLTDVNVQNAMGW